MSVLQSVSVVAILAAGVTVSMAVGGFDLSVGAVSVRAAALAATGADPGHNIVVEPVLLTRKALKESGVTMVEELSAKLPAFGKSSAATASWIPE